MSGYARTVPVFTPWTRTTPLPEVGTPESMVLDFKGLPSKKKGSGDERDPRNWDHAKNARDIAAFANSIGGTLLVGADDGGGTGKLVRFVDINPELATAVEGHYTEVVKDRVRPAPVVTFDRVPRGPHVLVAINVRPFAGHAVGAKQDGDAWAFPVRTLDQNVPFTPEQLPMLMIPELRRIATLLHAIPRNKGITIVATQPTRFPRPTYFITSLSEEDNCVVLQCDDPMAYREGWPRVLFLALDDIESVWHTPEPRWHLRAKSL